MLGLDSSHMMTLLMAVPRYIPDSVAAWQAKYLPFSAEKVARRYLEVSHGKAREVLKQSGMNFSRRENESMRGRC